MAPIPSVPTSSGSKKKEPRYVYLSEAKTSHSHKTWTEVSSSVPHFLQMGLLLSPIIYRCLLKVLCPVSRPITTVDCVLLKDINWALVARLGPEIISRACLCVLQGPSVCPHGTSRLPLDGRSWNLMFEQFLKTCRENCTFINIGQE